MEIKQSIKETLREVSNKYYIMRAKSVETEKYHDPRRKKIMEQRPLTDQEKSEIDTFYLENYGEKFRICGINTILLLRETSM